MKRKWCVLKKRNGDLYAQTNMKAEVVRELGQRPREVQHVHHD